MTNPSISPCPACGRMPRNNANGMPVCCDDGLYLYDDVMTTAWQKHCERALGRACRELDIETAEQLRAKVQPDPRVAVLEKALTKMLESDLSQVPYSQIKVHIEEALLRSQFIAAQRGEVEG